MNRLGSVVLSRQRMGDVYAALRRPSTSQTTANKIIGYLHRLAAATLSRCSDLDLDDLVQSVMLKLWKRSFSEASVQSSAPASAYLRQTLRQLFFY